MAETQKKTVVLVDSNALAHRAFHAFPATLATSKGEPTNAIYGYFSMLVQVLTTLKPESLICVFDTPARTFRDDLFDQYKANRPDTDIQLIEQLPKIMDVLVKTDIHLLSCPGFEADDVIGTLAKSSELAPYEKIIVTGDRDLFQVLDDNTKVYLAGNPFSSSSIFDSESASKKMGFPVSKMVLYKALRGDPSDNIPGVRGVGDVTATMLVNQYDSLADIYQHLDDIKPQIRQKLIDCKDMAELSQKLATIKTDVSLNIDIDKFDIDGINFAALKQVFMDYELKSLIKRVDAINPNMVIPTPEVKKEINAPVQKQFERIEVTSKVEFEYLMKKISDVDEVAIHSETKKDIFALPDYICLATEASAFLIQTKNIKKDDWQSLLKTISSKSVYAHNAKYLKHVFTNLGFNDFRCTDDLLLLESLISMGQVKGLPEELQSDGQLQSSLFQESPLYKQTHYILEQCKSFVARKQELMSPNMLKLYEHIEKPVSDVLYHIERNGIKLNPDELLDLSIQLNDNIKIVEADIYRDAGEEFNIASPKQLGNILFDKLGLKGGKKNKSGAFSTNEKFLLDHIEVPLIQNILLYRELYKLRSTYTQTLIDQINPATNRVHSTFNQAIAVTGRLSSTDPNLQNIPTGSDWGFRIRRAFVPDDKHILVSLDYSQQELRLLAEFSKDPDLRLAFSKGFDIHAYTASKIFNVEIASVTSAQRRSAKTVNFGVVYGISPYGLADRLKVPVNEAKVFIDSFYKSYPQVQEYFHEVVRQARENGYVETLYGRRKNASLLNSPNHQIRMASEREVINFPLQGSAAEIMKEAMVNSQKLLIEKYQDFAIMVLQVHDELMFEVKCLDTSIDRFVGFVQDVREVMNNCVSLEVPMLVEAKAGMNWADLKKLLQDRESPRHDAGMNRNINDTAKP